MLLFFDGGGATIASGIAGDFVIGFPAIITGWVLLADQVGSCVIDLWKDSYTNYPPTVADSITASAKPTLASAIKNQDTFATPGMVGWDRGVKPSDTFRVNVDSATTITRLHLALELHKPPKT